MSDRPEDTPEQAEFRSASRSFLAEHAEPRTQIDPWQVSGFPDDAEAKVVITSDGQNRRGSAMALKPAVDEAVAECPTVEHVLVVRRTGGEVDWNDSVDVWWHDIVDRQSDVHVPEAFDAEHPLFILYTSGSTGKLSSFATQHSSRDSPHPTTPLGSRFFWSRPPTTGPSSTNAPACGS